MPRAAVLVLDSVGIGGAPDAARYDDKGADTVGHIAERCAVGEGDRAGLRSGPLRVPNLVSLGIGLACETATGRIPPGLEGEALQARFGSAIETSRGKDTPSGHWEIAGLPVDFDWGYFPNTRPCFPPDLVSAICKEAGLPGILGDCHASGTAIIEELGVEHVNTGKAICYTSADSVFQIAAHEESFGLQRLYDVCAIVRGLVDPLRIGRVIARPFLGGSAVNFQRTPNRRDFSVPPPSPTILDRATAAGRDVVSIGKIADIFAHSGTGRVLKGAGNMACSTARSKDFHRWLTVGCSSPTSSTSIPSTDIVATLRAMRQRWRSSTPACRSCSVCFARRSADHHRGPWLRSDLEGNRPHT